MKLTTERSFLRVAKNGDSVTGVCELCMEDEVEADPFSYEYSTWTVSAATLITCRECGETNEEEE